MLKHQVFQRHGKIMEFEKKAKIMEKSWNFKMHRGKIMEFCFLIFSCMLLLRFSRAMRAIGYFHPVSIMENAVRIMENSWKNHGISFSEMAANPEHALRSLLLSY